MARSQIELAREADRLVRLAGGARNVTKHFTEFEARVFAARPNIGNINWDDAARELRRGFSVQTAVANYLLNH